MQYHEIPLKQHYAICRSEHSFAKAIFHVHDSWSLKWFRGCSLIADWLFVPKSQVTRYDVHWNPLLACFLSPQRPLRRCWGSPWGGGSVLVLSSRASVAPKQPQGRVRPPQSRAWFYASVHKKDIIDEGVYFASCEWGKRLRRCDQMIKFDHLIRWCIRGCSFTSPRPPSSSPSTRWRRQCGVTVIVARGVIVRGIIGGTSLVGVVGWKKVLKKQDGDNWATFNQEKERE